MLKKVLVISLVISIALFGVSLASEQSRPLTSSIVEGNLSDVVPTFVVNLTPNIYMYCCSNGNCLDQLEDRGFLIVQQIDVAVYNYGRKPSSSDATGKVEFFDVLRNEPVSVSFTIAPTASKTYGEIGIKQTIPGSGISLIEENGIDIGLRLSGLYLVKKDEGITASVTYQKNTKISTTNKCYAPFV